MTSWLILAATLPTSPSGLRVRVWRALKATHCATLREGVYILPAHAPGAAAFPGLDCTIREAGAQAHLLELPARDAAQEEAFRALFDRRAQYGELVRALKEARATLLDAEEPAARRALRALEQQLQAVQVADFFPGPAAAQAQTAFEALCGELQRHWSPGEPTPAEAALARLEIAHYQGRVWATRARPWVDRLATAWLIARFIDRQARFAWLADVHDAPQEVLGFDYDGAAFTHVGERVTFEVVAESFGLGQHAGLKRLGALVHVLDVGGLPLDEAPGVALLVRGLQALHADDDALLAAALPLFDALLAGLAGDTGSPR